MTMAQNTAAQISTISTAAAASRSTADSRRIDGEIDAGGWPCAGVMVVVMVVDMGRHGRLVM